MPLGLRLALTTLWLVVLAATATTARADDAIMLSVTARTGGFLGVAWAMAPLWLEQHTVETIDRFNVTLNGTLVAQLPATTTTYAFYGLRNNTMYAIQIVGEWTTPEAAAANGSLASNELVVSALDVTNPVAPPVPHVVDIGGGFLRVRITMPLDAGGVDIVRIHVTVRSLTDASSTSLSQDASEPEFTFYGLDAKTTYHVRAYVTNAAGYVSAQSPVLAADTRAVQLPGVCPPPTLLSVTGGSIRLQLNPPLDDGGARIKGYVVFMAVNGSSEFEEITNTVRSTQPNIVEIQRLPFPSNQPLRSLTRYDVKALAITMMDVCVPPSSVWNITAELVSVVTGAASLPEAPPAPYFLSATGGQVTIQLLMPGNMRGSVLTGFSVMLDGVVHGSLATNEEGQYSIAYLHANTSFVVQAAVLTNLGQSDWSAPIAVTAGSPSRPSSPRNVTVTDIAASRALIKWSTPVDSGGVSIIEYHLVIFSSSGMVTVATPGSSTTYLLNTLIAETSYTVKVVAINEIHLESPSSKLKGVTFQTLLLTPPSAPFGINAMTSTGGSIEIAWQAPEDSGGSGNDGLVYNVTMIRVVPCHTNVSNSSSCGACDVVRVPSADDRYEYDQNCVQPTTTSCPDGSANCCVTTAGSVFGSGHLCSRMGGRDRYRLVLGGATVTAFQQLNHSTAYFFAVQAINKAGRSPSSAIVGLRTSSQTPPSYPSDMRQTGGTGGSVTLTWDSPHDTGGTAIIGYQVYRDYRLLTSQPVFPPYVDCETGLRSSTQYLYNVAAVNASRREGSLGSLLVGTPPVTPPHQITSLSLAARTMSWLNISVTTGCDLGGSSAVSYQFMLAQEGVAIASGFFACCSQLLVNLQPGQEYQVSVRVGNEAATMDWVNGTFTTTSGVPAQPLMALRRANSYSLIVVPDTSNVPDQEIFGYDIAAYKDGSLVQGNTYPCDSIIGPGLRACPSTFRIDGLSPNTTYQLSTRATGPNGVSEWSSQSFTTSNESRGVVEFTASGYTVSSGSALNVTVRRVDGTAGSLNLDLDVSQPDTVRAQCQCFHGEGCSCQLHLRSSDATTQPGTLFFLDGQESQTILVTVWEDDPSLTQPLAVVLKLFGAIGDIGAQAQAVLQVSQSQRQGFPSFTRSQVDVFENSSYAKINVVRVNGSSGALTFKVETFDISSNATKHYLPLSQTVQMGDRQSVATLWIRLIDNRYYEGTRIFGIRLREYASNALGEAFRLRSLSTRRVSILDDEGPLMQLAATPSTLSAVRVTGGEVELVWLPTNPSGAATGGYLVRVSTPTSTTDAFSMYNTTATPTFILSSLQPATLYRYQVAAWSAYGVSEFSGTTLVLTTGPSPPSAPMNFRALAVGSSSLDLAWDPPRDLGGASLSGFQLMMQGDDGGFRLLAEIPVWVRSHMAEGLTASTAYSFSIAASTTAFPVSLSSAVANITVSTGVATLPAKPPPPKLIRQPTGGTLTFLIEEPSDIGGTVITDYSLFMRKVVLFDGDTNTTATNVAAPPPEEPFQIVCSDATPWANNSSARSCTVFKLLAGTNYEAFVVLHNAVGSSEASDRVVHRTAPTINLPSAPESFRAARVTAGNIYLEWDLPLDLGGTADAMGYTLFQRTSTYYSDSYFVVYDGQDSTERHVAIKGLSRGTAYAFAVVAQNAASYCVNLAAQRMTEFMTVVTLQFSLLSSPQSFVQVLATGGAITMRWQAPDDLAGVPLFGYIVELSSDESGSNFTHLTPGMLSAGMTEFTHYGLTEQTVYRYAVSAVNQDGPGDRSTIAEFSTTVCTPPQGIVDAHVVGVSGGRITIAWGPPQDSGGRPIQYYQVIRTDQPNKIYTVASTTVTDTSGLVAQSQYLYSIRAFNGLLFGYSGYVWAVTGLPTVSDPPLPTTSSSYGGRLELTWMSAQDTGGVPVLEYVVVLFERDGVVALDTYTGATMNYTFTALSANTPYIVQLVAVNEVGQGPATRHNVSTGDVDPPSPPPAPIVSEILGGSLRLTVYMPSYNGGEAVTLQLRNSAAVVGTFTQDQASTLITGLVAQTQYRFRVIAINSRGQTSSDEVVVSTAAISTPSAVAAVQLVDASFDRLAIAWAPVEDTGGDLLLQYEVTYFACDANGSALPSSSVIVAQTSMPELVLMSLNHTTNYSIAVRPLTSSGIYGESSPIAILMTEQPLTGRIIVQSSAVLVQEGSPTVSVPLLRVEGSFGETNFTYQVIDETAVAGVNYDVLGTGGSMGSGVKSGEIILSIRDDAIYNPNITFIVQVQDTPSNTFTQSRVTIQDNGDAGFIAFAAPQFHVLENDGVASLRITRNGGVSPRAVIEPFVVAAHTSLVTRFTLVEPNITFEDGDTIQDLTVLLENDAAFQFWPDTIVIGFRIIDGGVWIGDIVSANLTAVDDGDVSPPKEITALQIGNTTGGSVQLFWSSPMDRGGLGVDLAYVVEVATNGNTVVSTTVPSTTTIVYGLTELTTYEVTVSAVNAAGTGAASNHLLLTLTRATPPTAPLDVVLIAASSSTLVVSWRPPVDAGGSPIVGYTVYSVSSSGIPSPFPFVSCALPTMCSIRGLFALTTYQIQVQAISAAVSSAGLLSTVVAFQTSNPDVPDPPPPANVTWVSGGAMTIEMFTPVNVGGTEVEQYRLFMRGPYDLDFVFKYQGTASLYTVYRLDRRTSYEIKYQVINSVGASDFGPVLIYQTLERSLVSAPLDLTVVNATGGAITLSWTEPLDLGGRAITGYTVMMRSPSMHSSIVAYESKEIPETTGVVYGLTANTTYTMFVIAYTEVSNCFSPTEWVPSAPIQATTTVATLPTPAPTVLLVRVTGGIVELMWSPPQDEGGVPITGYTVSLVSPTGTIAIFSALGTGPFSFVHNDLIESTMYTYLVKATSSVGESPLSAPLVVKTLVATAPSAPLNARQLQYVTGGAIQIGWDRPVDTGGQPLQGFWVYRDGAAVAQNLDASARSFIDKQSLRAATSYVYTIRAVSWSTIGSELSAPVSAKTAAASIPQTPYLVRNVTGPSFLLFDWAPDLDEGGLSVSLFETKLMRGSTQVGAYVGTDTSFRFTKLIAATTYTFVLVAYNQVGGSAPLSVAFTTLAAAPPEAPPAPVAVVVFGGNMTVEVTCPMDTGGTNVTDMRVYEAQLGFLGTVALPGGSLKAQFTVFGLVKTTEYTITTSAVNRLGESARSAPLAVRTGPVSLPGAISMPPNVTGATGTTLSVVWTVPVDSGGDVSLSYELRFVDPAGVVVSAVSVTRAATGTSLKFFTLYAIAVRVVNAAGKSAWSPSVSARTLPDAAGEFNLDTSTANVLEDAGHIELTVQRTKGLSSTVIVSYSVVSSGVTAATLGTDFALSTGPSATTGSVVFASLQVAATIKISIVNDNVYELPDEHFTVQLTTAVTSGTTTVVQPPKIGVNTSTVVTILDDGDAGYVSFSLANYTVREDAVTLELPIVREGATSSPIVLGFTFTDGTATGDRDFRRPLLPAVPMEDGQTSAVLRVGIINDKIYEYPNEFFTITMTMTKGGARIKRTVATITILDDNDHSAPATPLPPVAMLITGGSVRFALQLPVHNGSAVSLLGSYVFRVARPLTEEGLFNVTVPVASVATVGRLVARATYAVAVAAMSVDGLSPFSPSVLVTTTVPTLPGPVADVSLNASTGGSVRLAWAQPEDTGGVPITKYRIYQISTRNAPELVGEILEPTLRHTVYGLTAQTTYRFAVQAGNGVLFPEIANGWGELGPPVQVTTPEASLPGATLISKVAVSDATGGAVHIGWSSPLDTGGTPIVAYDVYVRNATTSFFVAAQVTHPASRSTSVDGLLASSWYEIFLLAVNAVRNVTVAGQITCAPGSKLVMTTQDLSKQLVSGAVLRVGERVLLIGDMTRATKGTLPLAVAHVGKSIAKQTAALVGVATYFANLSTAPPTIPQVPPAATLLNATGGAIAFQVDPPGDTGGVPIETYVVTINGELPDEDNVMLQLIATSHLRKTLIMRIANLAPQTSIEVAAVAVNAISLCDFSKKDSSLPVVFHTTTLTPPDPPQIVLQYVTGGGMKLSLVEPFDKGGAPIIRYLLYMATSTTKPDWTLVSNVSHDGDSVDTSRQVSTVVAPLNPQIKYFFLLSVNNGEFESKNSSLKSFTTSGISPPGPCEEPRLASATGGLLTIAWDDPLDNGGAPVIDFTVSLQLAGASGSTSGKRTVRFWQRRNCTFYGLSNETEYVVSVRARNEKGLGPDGPSATFSTTKATPPGGTIAVTAVATTGGAVVLSFNEPADLGGTPRQDMQYRVFVDNDMRLTLTYQDLVTSNSLPSVSSGSGRRLAESAPRGVVVGGLDPLSLYDIQIQSVNDVAAGTVSDATLAATTDATVPSAPQSLAVSAVTGGSVLLHWTAPVDTGGLPLLDYVVFMAMTQDGPVSEVCRDTITSCRVRSLKAATSYWLNVVATNTLGSSSPSTSLTATTLSLARPSVPGKISIVAVTEDTIACTWTAPVDSGGAVVSGYSITVNDETNSVSLPLVSSTATSATIAGLSPAARYSLSVTAANSLGASEPSIPRFLTTATTTNAPADPTVSCVSKASVSLQWYPHLYGTQYRLLRDGLVVYTGAATRYVDATVVSSTAYQYTLETFISGAWTGVTTSPVQVTTLDSASDEASCSARQGFVSALAYAPRATKSWLLRPTDLFSTLTLEFATFDLECDHDVVRIESADDGVLLWQGGCTRVGTFVIHATTNVRVLFTADATVEKRGFELFYEVDRYSLDDTSTRIAPPQSVSGAICSSRGARQNDGTCMCSVGFTGEGCTNHVVCCTDPSRCWHDVCNRDAATVIVVSTEFGDDSVGTGAMMTASEDGTAAKAVKTLSKALSLAGAGGTIFVYPGAYTGARNRELQLASRRNITIESLKGFAWTMVDCENAGRAFTIATSTVVLNGLTIQNGRATVGDGGSLLVTDSSVTMHHVRITSSTAALQNGGAVAATRSAVTAFGVRIDRGMALGGGGISLTNSQLVLDQSNITSCRANDGGGVLLQGLSTVTGTNEAFIAQNTATRDGGGVCIASSVASVTNLPMFENEATRGGGLVAWHGSDVTLDRCTVNKNRATVSGGGVALVGSVVLRGNATSVDENIATTQGGGLFVEGTHVSVVFDSGTAPSSIQRNQAVFGAGLAVISSDLTLTGVSIENGFASESGGGIGAVDSTVTLQRVAVVSNVASSMGGGVHAVASQLTVEDTVVVDSNQATMNGGGLYLRDSSVRGRLVVFSNSAIQRGGGFFGEGRVGLRDVVVRACAASEGSGGFLNEATATMEQVRLIDCTATTLGGGVALVASVLTVRSAEIQHCSAVAGGGIHSRGTSIISGDLVVAGASASTTGGGLYATETLTLSHVVIKDSSAARGGGLFVERADVTATNVSVASCTATEDGGGWCADSSWLTLEDVSLTGHTSGTMGGGLALLLSRVSHNNVTVTGNHAATNGGGVAAMDSDLTAAVSLPAGVVSSRIANNVAQDYGGNVYVEGPGTLTGMHIAGGEAGDAGGGVAMKQASVEMRDCEILENRASRQGGGLSVRDDSICEMLNSSISANVAVDSGGGVRISDSVFRHGAILLHHNVAPFGGAFAIDGTSNLVPLIDGTVSYINASQAIDPANARGDGSALFLAAHSQVKVAGLHIYDGVARRGAVFVDAATLHLRDCEFGNNTATEGAALYANANSDVNVTSTRFVTNVATHSGGAVVLAGGSTGRVQAQITDCVLADNRAVKTGGAMAFSFADVTLANVRLESNSVESEDGGGGAIAAITSTSLNVTDCVLLNNRVFSDMAKGASLLLLKATTTRLERTTMESDAFAEVVPREGGALYVSDKDSSVVLIDCDITSGRSVAGGAVYTALATLSLVRTTVRDARADEFGGGLFVDSGDVTVDNCTLSGNSAFYDGGAIYVKGTATVAITASVLSGNRVQDGGGALFIAPGAGATVTVTNSSLEANVNRGLGSAMFVGRKNKLTLVGTTVQSNGGSATEGGALYAVDAQVVIDGSTFAGNEAVRGAAIELSRDATLTLIHSELVDNHAAVWGGALYMSVRAIASIENATLRGNTAATGGALYLLGSSTLTMRGTTVASNTALSFGGAIAVVGRARVDVASSVFASNAAFTGGVVAVTQNGSVALATTVLVNNSAQDFGGGIYVDTLTPTSERAVDLQALDTSFNTARAGPDIYWVYHAWFELTCASCRSLSSTTGALELATSPVTITTGWWPTRVTSGVSFGVTKRNWTNPMSVLPSEPTNASVPITGSNDGGTRVPLTQAVAQRRLLSSSSSSSGMDAGVLDTIVADPNQSSPYMRTLWPTVVVRDFYGAIAAQDNRTQCLARKVATELGKFAFFPASSVDVARGYVTFEDAQVLADSRPEPFELSISCTLADTIERALSVTITVDNCTPGYENADGRCIPCKKGMYSLDGVKCHACPLGATCEALDESKMAVGVSIPSRADGYFLFDSRESYLGSSCSDPSSWDANDPCKSISGSPNMTYRLQRCASQANFSNYWPPRRVFACLSSLEYYACDTRDACVAEEAATARLATSVYELSQRKQCEAGYGSVTCATCQSGYYKVSNGTCNPCSDPTDPNVAKMTRLLAMVPLGFAMVAAVLVWYYFSNTTERELMKQARAARQFQIYDPTARPQSLLLATTFVVRQRVTAMMARARQSLVLRRRRPLLFQIEPRAVRSPPFRAEKFKILLGFFQIFGGFKKVYEIPWPDEMSRLMDVFSIADFSLVDTTGIECFIRKDYFSNYRLSVVGVLVLLLLTALLLSWGVVRYRVKLAGLPGHCVDCGLPVFKMLRSQPKTHVRRATMASMLRLQQKEHAMRTRRRSFATRATDAMASQLDAACSRTKQWWATTRFGRALHRFVVFTRLPASSSRHEPTCPTTQRIESEVLFMVVRSNLRLWRSRVRLRLNYQSFQNKCIKLVFWILLLFYPELSQRVVGMFYCDEIGRQHYMSRDKSRLCYEGEWLYYLPLTVLLIVVWVVGVPLLFWSILFVKRRSGISDKLVLLEDPKNCQLKQRLLRELREDLVHRGVHIEPEKMQTFEKDMMAEYLYNKRLSEPSMVAQVGFIYASYRNEFWWFEVWDLGRKLFLNCIIGLLAKTGANRIIAGLIVFLIYLSVMLFYQPFKNQSDSTLASVTQIQLFVTLFCGLLLKMGAVHLQASVVVLLTYTAFVSNVLTMAFAVLSILYEKFDASRKARRRAREEYRRAIQAHVRKLWLKAYGWALTEVYLRKDSIHPMPFRVILELARRDREEKKLLEMDLQLARSLYADSNASEHGENVSASDIRLDLPRPGTMDMPPRSSSSSLRAKAAKERGSAGIMPAQPEVDVAEASAVEDNQRQDTPDQ